MFAEGAAPNPILPIGEEILIGSIAFAILCFVLMKYVFPWMEQTFKARVDAIDGCVVPQSGEFQSARWLAEPILARRLVWHRV